MRVGVCARVCVCVCARVCVCVCAFVYVHYIAFFTDSTKKLPTLTTQNVKHNTRHAKQCKNCVGAVKGPCRVPEIGLCGPYINKIGWVRTHAPDL